MWIYTFLIQLYFTLLELTNCPHILKRREEDAVFPPIKAVKNVTSVQFQTPDLIQTLPNNCCNGILGYAGPFKFMPCSEMKCCNATETVALEKVNHALGFCFRCVPQNSDSMCFSVGQEVASTNQTAVDYKLRTCCSGLKFKVFTYLNDVALVIKCVPT